MTRLKILWLLRSIAIIGQSSAIIISQFFLALNLDLLPLIVILTVLIASNGYLWWRLTQKRELTDETIAAQLVLDMMALASLLYLTGGLNNPFASLLLLPLTTASLLLPLGHVCGLWLLAIFLYSSLLVDFVPLTLSPQLSIIGTWLNFGIIATLMTGFISFLAHQSKQKQQLISSYQDIQHRQEQILALGTLAAGTAHELGTPLSTIAVLAHELQEQVPQELSEDMALLVQQVQQCKQLLTNMVQRVELAKIQEFSLLSAQQLVTQVLDKFQLLRPMIRVFAPIDVQFDHVYLATDTTLQQAILNLLNNAADASADAVELQLHIHQQKLWIDICDRGLGLPAEVLNHLGQDRISTKHQQGGMGIGLLLANATLERLGGEINFLSREGGGVIARVVLPIHHSI